MPIKYDDKFVKRPREEIEWTPELLNELKKCKKDVFHFIKYFKIVNPDLGEITFEPYDYQKKLIRKFIRYRYNIALCSRQSGKTTSVSAFALHYGIFNKDKTIGIVSNKESSAKMILDRIKKAYMQLPIWLKPGVTEFSKTFITFDNGTRILISATSPDAFRGESINLLVCDEFAFVPGNQAEEFWAANYPTISASRGSKIIIISTPNGLFNIFHRLYTEAETGKNSFKHTIVSWQEVPGRDKKWADEQRKNLGKKKFNQEFAVKFIGSTNTVIDEDTLKVILTGNIPPIKYDFNDRFRVWEKPQDGAQYVIGVDPSKGTGEHYATIQVLKIDKVKPVNMKQVAVFEDNLTDIYEFTEFVNRISLFYNRAYIMCENNGEGSIVVKRLWWDLENDKLVNTGAKEHKLGIRATKNTKPKAVLLMKKLIEDGSLKLVDNETLKQLGSFIEENNKFFGKDMSDDLVSGLYWACYIFERDILDEHFEFIEKEDEGWGILTDVNMDEEDWSWLKDSFTD